MKSTWCHGRYVLGVEELDDDHRDFLALLEILSDAEDAEFPILFQKLVDHIRVHFVREGRLMRLGKFPALGEHEEEHHRVLGELLQFNRAVKRGRLSLARAYVKIGPPEWFGVHLSTMDSALAAHIKVDLGPQLLMRALQA
ncbi:MAG: hemerythrin domain-containing protein [Thiobacillaceae bacterium]